MHACVQNDGEYFEPFPATNGVKRGCVMTPTLFSVKFSAVPMDGFHDNDAGFPIRYRFDSKLFKLRRLQAKSKVHIDVLDKLLYADDMAENAKKESKLHGVMARVSQACDNYDLTSQYLESRTANQHHVTVNGQSLQVVDKFLYMESALSRAVQTNDKVTDRTSKASVASGRLRGNVWEQNGH